MAYSREDLGFTRPSWLDWLTYGGVEGHVELETMRERILSRMGTMELSPIDARHYVLSVLGVPRCLMTKRGLKLSKRPCKNCRGSESVPALVSAQRITKRSPLGYILLKGLVSEPNAVPGLPLP